MAGGPMPEGTVIHFPGNSFYNDFTYTTESPGPSETKTTVFVRLQVIRQLSDTMPPPRTYFSIQIPSISSIIYGVLEIPVALFAGEFTDKAFFFQLDGPAGAGKSTVMNGLFNIFTMNGILYPFVSSKDFTEHCTKAYGFFPIHVQLANEENGRMPLLYEDIINRVRVTLVDKPGFRITDKGEKQNYNDLGIYVCELSLFREEENELYRMVRNKLQQVTPYGQQPLLVVTKMDLQTGRGLEDLKARALSFLADENNIHFLTNYINGTTTPDIEKNHQYFKLLLNIKKEALKRVNKKTLLEQTAGYINNRFNLPEEIKSPDPSPPTPTPPNDHIVVLTVEMPLETTELEISSSMNLAKVLTKIGETFNLDMNDYFIKRNNRVLTIPEMTFKEDCLIKMVRRPSAA
ncbi:hypothetical protein SAMD00019534_070100 [Acytostelium subglobosum LB1]|uniref:hypothetical protein n=1 Tax=Acytostelium subglobosum LB1 TaxID=1410327 RepID=UPI0006451977|nr:hypothetical protein SAMD00019534_070100 [Acytostelium subglobosum LB1]GAM23835.1 hypothetical protein SAMD00019534_070100 [Acytostelium subglobosum LB1]|eukprot:XP_012752871.1 hypothetical protein SAMD00019534_070100 [Acytostelium subglobosum LB1]